ncbi:MAG: GyrI-like domain-containing protein, partial [Acidobacteriota bacterium]
LKQLAEGLPKAYWCSTEIEIVTVPPVTIAYTARRTSADHAEISAALAASYSEVGRFLSRNGLQLAGAPICITQSHSPQEYMFEAGIPVDKSPERPVPAGSAVQIGRTYEGRVVRAVHMGPYGRIPETFEKIHAFAAAHGLEEGERPWEEYVSDPGNTPEAELITRVYMPVK